MICCPSPPEAAKTASREARISLFIIFIFACDLPIGPVFVVLRSNQKGKGVREIVKDCSLMKPDTSSVTIVWSDEVQAFVIFCTISLCSLARRLSCPLSRFKLYSPGRRLPAAAMALKVGSYTRATKTAAYHRSGKLNLDVANII
jgi:hypothetical protein